MTSCLSINGVFVKGLLIIFSVFFIMSCENNINGKENSQVDTLIAAASAGDIAKQVELGVMYRDGKGVAKDIHESIKWFEMASKQGNTIATMSLGVIYGSGDLGVRKDSIKAIGYYKVVAESSSEINGLAQMLLAKKYEETGDKQNATMWYKKVLVNNSASNHTKEMAESGLNRFK